MIRSAGGLKGPDVTQYDEYLDRRAVILDAPVTVLAAPLGAAAAPAALHALRATPNPAYKLDDPPTPLKYITSYNNFYEFGVNKEDPARLAGSLKTRPWTVKVEGLCAKPRGFDIDEILRMAPLEERIYSLRCVEAWSMVIPWIGFSLAPFLSMVNLP